MTATTIQCPRCQTTNPAEAKFCLNCGNALAGQAAALPVETPQDRLRQYIPAQLLAKLESSRADRGPSERGGGVQGERRVVTVLFCDVKGSTALAERLDPEEWAEIMNGAFEHLIAPVYRYEGTLARLMGDAILAFFGAPIAHEDDPERAVRAGLEIVAGIQGYREQVRRRWGFDLNVRVGINTGLVVVGEVGSDLRVEYTAMGDAVNLASRMEQAAEPGTVQVAEATYRAVARQFEVESLGGIEVKGKDEPVPAYRVLRARPGYISTRGLEGEGISSPLVGRERELRELEGRVDRLLSGAEDQARQGQLVAVLGEAGLGKSRLVAELRQGLVDRGLLPDTTNPVAGQAPAEGPGDPQPGLRWYEGRSLSYETMIPYAPFIALLGGCFGLTADEEDAARYARLQAGVAAVAPERAAALAPFLATLLGIALPGEAAERVRYLQPPQLRERVFGAVRDYVAALAGERPIVLVFEDLHWADPTSLDLLERLMALTDEVPLMLLALVRPQRQEPSWRFHEAAARDHTEHYTAIELAPLDEGQARELVANLLHIEGLGEDVRRRILEKAEGNPFYVEEVIRSLLDAGLVVRQDSRWVATGEIARIEVPGTLAGVITARLDRLDEESKRVAQTSAVIGRQFQFDVLSEVYEAPQVVDPALDTLERRELIRHRDPQIYLFKHVLTQETAYNSVLLSRRRRLHARVAECLERHAPERVHEIGWHYWNAREYKRAIPYVARAAERDRRAYATPEAIKHYQDALAMLQEDDDPALRRPVYEGLGAALMLNNDFAGAVETYRQMQQYAEARGDIPMKVSALNKLSQPAMFMGDFAAFERYIDEAERLAREYHDPAGLAEMFTIKCQKCMSTGEFDVAERYLGESVAVGQALDQQELQAFGLTHGSLVMAYMGRLDEAWMQAQEAERVVKEVGQREREAELLTLPRPFYHLHNGDLDAARHDAAAGMELAERIGYAFSVYQGGYTLGVIAQLRGEHERAIACYQRALAGARERGYPFLVVSALCALGAAYLDVGEAYLDRVREYQGQAVELLNTIPNAAVGGGTAWADLGWCALAEGDVERADQYFQAGLAHPMMEGWLYRPRFLAGAAEVALARGEFHRAQGYVDEARDYAEERELRHFYPLVAQTGARVSEARGEPERAWAQYAQAERLATPLGMRPAIWRACGGAARALAALGRAEEAEAKRREARATIDELASLFEDGELRARFLASATRRLEQPAVGGERHSAVPGT